MVGKELRLIKICIKIGAVKAAAHRLFKIIEPLPRFHGRTPSPPVAGVHNMQRYRLQLKHG